MMSKMREDIMQCPKCEYKNRAGAKFCEECGTKLEPICPNCGSEVRPQAKFCDECGTKLVEAVPAQVAVPLRLEDMQDRLYIPEPLRQRMDIAEQEIEGENRLVTALFADISGFTPMSQRLTPEAVVERVNQCFQVITDAVYRYEGSVNKFMGDCVLAFFGAPLAHENDPERAILSALDIREAISGLGVNISIGINTGMTYFGAVGTEQHQEISAYGHDVNLAERLQEAANPGQILISTSTYRLARKAFDFKALDARILKGIESPVPIYEVLSVKEHPEKLRGIEGIRARMIGREQEFAELKEATGEWLMRKQGQIVSIIGEAGIGKSRLVSELKTYLADQDGEAGGQPRYLEGRCVYIGQPISYLPFIDILRTYFSLSQGDDVSTIARKVTQATTELFPQNAEEVLPSLGHLMSIRFGNELDDRLKFATPEQIRHQTLMRLRDFFETLARKQPLLLILEDLHWADDLSLDLISLLMDALATTPLMLLCVYRPERDHRCWQLSSVARRKCPDGYTEITLKQLSSRESRQLVETLLTIDNLPGSAKGMILRKTEGNPFFIEEVIRSLVEQDLVYHDGERWKARSEISDINVPDTIQTVLLARVDRLEAKAKHILQCASVIGRMFEYRLLEHLAQQERDLDRYLSEFEERELVYEERTVPELEYAFKHALTQEATYQSILGRRRKEFHHQVAAGIEQLYRERLDEYYEQLAYHYDRSEDAEKAVEYLLKAGEKAKRSYANEVAISQFRKVLEILEQRGMERNDLRLESLHGLGEVYLGIGKIAESVEAFEEVVALVKEMELPPHQLARSYYWITDALLFQSRFDEAICYGEMGLEILGNDTECLEAALMNSRIAVGSGNKGDMEKFREYTRKNMAFIKRLPYSVELRSPYVHIVQVVADQDRDFEAALDWVKELEARAGQHHDLRGLASAWLYQGYIFINKGDLKNGLSSYQKSLQMYGRIGDDKHASWCQLDIGDTLLNLGNIEESEAHARLSLTMVEQVENPRDIAVVCGLSGAIAVSQGLWEEAIFHFQRSLEGAQTIGNLSSIASSHLCLGRTYLKKGDPHLALQSFQEAADVAIALPQASWLSDALGGMEATHMALGTSEKHVLERSEGFLAFCRTYRERHAGAVKKLSLRQWYLEPAEPSKEFPHLAFADAFETRTIDPSWNWIDEFEDCAYRIVDAGRLEICAANGRDLNGPNLSAPRFMREISGDFAVEVCISSASNEKPQIGGLLVWKDRDNFLRFEIGAHGPYEVRLHGYIDGKLHVAGRGLLSADGNEEVHLRLERAGAQFFAYCSVDGENWLTCGRLALPLDDPPQVGIHAIGMIDRTIFCGSFKEGTATLFRGFQVWTRLCNAQNAVDLSGCLDSRFRIEKMKTAPELPEPSILLLTNS